MLKLKLQYFGHLMQGSDSLEKTLLLGKIEGERRRGWQRMRQLDDITGLMGMSLSKLREIVRSLVYCSLRGLKELGTQQQQQSLCKQLPWILVLQQALKY